MDGLELCDRLRPLRDAAADRKMKTCPALQRWGLARDA